MGVSLAPFLTAPPNLEQSGAPFLTEPTLLTLNYLVHNEYRCVRSWKRFKEKL